MTSGDARAIVGHQLGAFEVEALLPIGGLPECFKARHVELGREVAVKLLPSTLVGGRETLTALRDETRRIAALRHPNILPVYGVAETQGILFAVTSLPSESLRDRLDREDLLPATDAVRLAAQLAWALHALHSIGLVHGDVQPGTLLFDADGTLQLADFGVARALVRQRGQRSRFTSRTWPLAGVRTYVAPEGGQTGEISVRGDIYALGAVLYEMLIGTLPRQQAMLGEPELVTAPLPPSMRSSDTWPEISAVALKALERDPARRYPDARAFAIALRRAVNDQPERPRGPSLRDALTGVWHPEADEPTQAGEVETFKKKLATMPPAPTVSPASQPTFKERLATAPPVPQTRPPAHKPTMPPAPPLAPRFGPPLPEDLIGTTLLPNRTPPTPKPEDIATQSGLSQPGLSPRAYLPPRLTSEPPATGAPPASPTPPTQPAAPAPDVPEEEYVSPAELAQILAGRQPGRARRVTAALAGLALLMAFGAGTVGILTGFGRGTPAGPATTKPGATATVGATVTNTVVPTVVPVTATVRTTVTKYLYPAPFPTWTMQPTMHPPPTATPQPTATPTPTATPIPTPTPTSTPIPTPSPTPISTISSPTP
jgi:eukaryotic-like serine/threonine-protein kinase